MSHPLVHQMRFARSEFVRGLDGVTEDEGMRRFVPINSIGWMVGHMASHEQRFWLSRAQGVSFMPEIDELAGWGRPATTPSLAEMWDAWRAITAAVDPWLDTLTTDLLRSRLTMNGREHGETIGSMLQRTIYHYWFHTGESQAVRQLLGHTGLSEFVGAIGIEAPYEAESAAEPMRLERPSVPAPEV